MGLSPVKSLRASAVILNRTAEQDAAWVRQVEAAKGRLRQRQGPTDATVVTGTDPAVEGSEPAEMVAPCAVEAGPRSSATAEAAIEVATGEAPVRGVERARADVTIEEVASVSGQEAALARGLLPQQDPLAEPAGTMEGGAVEPLTGAPGEEALAPEVPTVEARVPEPSSVEAPVVEGPAPLGGRAPTAVDLTLDDIPLDKGKQAMRVEGGEVAG
jgi:hypothetical protein